jgi:aspartyl protease family protein
VLGSVVRNICILVAVMAVAAIALRENSGESPPVPKPAGPAMPDRTATASANELVVRADGNGHFLVSATVGPRDIEFMVDTGASMVALSPQDAEAIGFFVHQLDYSGKAETANGVARFAPVVIEEIAVGDIVVRNVPAAVVETPMRRSLLGMTFLRKLAGFEVRGDRLILRW